tara:strand:+ start:286 stop:897 length:612 start_codon:yes stop_codon:yes gene_type:complete
MSKYSSFKEHQLITENWRRFLTEESEEEALPADVLNALDILSDAPMEEGWQPMPLPISPDDLRAKQRDPLEWDERSPTNQAALAALANAIHGTAHGALLLKKGAELAGKKTAEYLEQNPDKVAAIKTIRDAILRGGDAASRILWKVAALVAAGALVALPAFMVYDAARGATDDTYEQVIDWSEPSAEERARGGWLDPAPGGAR